MTRCYHALQEAGLLTNPRRMRSCQVDAIVRKDTKLVTALVGNTILNAFSSAIVVIAAKINQPEALVVDSPCPKGCA